MPLGTEEKPRAPPPLRPHPLPAAPPRARHAGLRAGAPGRDLSSGRGSREGSAWSPRPPPPPCSTPLPCAHPPQLLTGHRPHPRPEGRWSMPRLPPRPPLAGGHILREAPPTPLQTSSLPWLQAACTCSGVAALDWGGRAGGAQRHRRDRHVFTAPPPPWVQAVAASSL